MSYCFFCSFLEVALDIESSNLGTFYIVHCVPFVFSVCLNFFKKSKSFKPLPKQQVKNATMMRKAKTGRKKYKTETRMITADRLISTGSMVEIKVVVLVVLVLVVLVLDVL